MTSHRASSTDSPAIIITGATGWSLADLKEIWRYRELLWTLTTRDIRIRYKQTVIGIAWAVVQPFMTMVVFTLIFGQLAKLPSDGLPYPVFSLAAIVPWQFFNKALTQGSMSLVSMGGVMSKVYFPRVLAPLASILAGLIDFAIAFAILIGIMIWYGVYPSWTIVLLPLFILMAIATALSVSLWLSGINVEYRDVQHTLPFLAQIWMFVTPVVYPASMVPEQYRLFYMLNPMAGVIEGFRWALLDGPPPSLAGIGLSATMVAVLAATGLIYFSRVEKNFVDRL